MNTKDLAQETLLASTAYLVAVVLSFDVLMKVQNIFFQDFATRASLLFLPHGVKVLTAWLLGWRSVPALLPGVFLGYLYIAGMDTFMLSRLAGISIAVLTAPLIFHILAKLGWNLHPGKHRAVDWLSIVFVGILTSFIGGALTNLTFGNPPVVYVAYFIGDISGLFFLMMLLMLFFRYMRLHAR